jgi:hypothetical protein
MKKDDLRDELRHSMNKLESTAEVLTNITGRLDDVANGLIGESGASRDLYERGRAIQDETEELYKLIGDIREHEVVLQGRILEREKKIIEHFLSDPEALAEKQWDGIHLYCDRDDEVVISDEHLLTLFLSGARFTVKAEEEEIPF